MRKIILMFVVLITSITNAQTFDFECNGPTVESDLSAIYADGTTPPVLTDLINNTSDTVEASNDSSDFFKSLGADSGYTVVSFGGDEIGFFFRIDAIDAPEIYSEVEDINTPAGHRAFTLQIVKHIWDLLYPNYVVPGSVEAEIIAMYEANTPPTELANVINVAAGDAFQSSSIGQDDPRRLFIKKFDKYGLTFTDITDPDNSFFYATYADNEISPVPAPGGRFDFSEANFKLWMLEIAKAIWLYGHSEYANLAPYEQELIAIYGSNVYPTELGTIINDAALAVEYGIAGNAPRSNFIKSLAYFNVSVTSVFDHISKPSEANLSNGNVVPNIGTNANTSSMNPAQFAVFAFEVIKRFWSIGYPDEAAAQLRIDRIEDVKLLGNDEISIQVALDNIDGNVIGIEYNGSTSHFNIQPYDLSNPTGFVGLEDLTNGEYIELKKEITSRVDVIWKPILQARRIVEINALDKNGVVVQVASDDLSTLVYLSPNTNTGLYFIVDDYGNADKTLGGLTPDEYTGYKNAIISYRNDLDLIPEALAAFYGGGEPDSIAAGAPNYGNQLPTIINARAVEVYGDHDAMLKFLRNLSEGANGNFGNSDNPLTINGISFYPTTGFVVTRNLDRDQASGNVGSSFHDIDLGTPTLYHNSWDDSKDLTDLAIGNFTTLAYHVMVNFHDLQD